LKNPCFKLAERAEYIILATTFITRVWLSTYVHGASWRITQRYKIQNWIDSFSCADLQINFCSLLLHVFHQLLWTQVSGAMD
jgi:hypothetical protein